MPASKRYRKLMEEAQIPGAVVNLGLSRDPIKWTEQSRILNGKPFSFIDRPYLHQLYRETAREVYLVKGRQTEASEWLVNLLMCNAAKNPNSGSLYMSATQEFAYVFSNNRFLDRALEVSPVWQKLMRVKDHHTRQANLHNKALIWFRGAHDKYKEARSLPVDFLYLDEMQSQSVEHIDVAIKGMSHSKHKRIIGVGTGDYEDTGWYRKWHKGVQYEWDVEAQAWVVASGGDPLIHSYHLPQTIVPWITPADIERDYNAAMSENVAIMEIMGWWVQGVKKPITTAMMEDLRAASLALTPPDRIDAIRDRGPLFAGIDFGGGQRANTVFWLSQAIDEDIPIFQLRWAQTVNDHDVETQADKLIRLLEMTNPTLSVMDEGGGIRQMQKIEDRFDAAVHKCRFTIDHDKPLNLDKLYVNNVIKVNRTHAVEGVIDLIARWHTPPGSPPVPRYLLPYADPKLIDWFIPHFTCITSKNVKSSTGHEYIKYDKEPEDHHDALFACVYNYVAYRVWLDQHRHGDILTGEFGSES